jgi:hypothetical protein
MKKYQKIVASIGLVGVLLFGGFIFLHTRVDAFRGRVAFLRGDVDLVSPAKNIGDAREKAGEIADTAGCDDVEDFSSAKGEWAFTCQYSGGEMYSIYIFSDRNDLAAWKQKQESLAVPSVTASYYCITASKKAAQTKNEASINSYQTENLSRFPII